MIYLILAIVFAACAGFSIARLLGRRHYTYVGNIVVTENDGVKLFSLELDGDPEKITRNKEVTFRVVESDRK